MKSDLRTVANEEETYFTDAQNYAAVTTASGVATIAGGDTVSLSTGNSVATVTHDGTGYCLKITSTKSTNYFTYDSTKGGLQPINTACPTTYTTAG